MKDRSEEIRRFLKEQDTFELVETRIEDAFDWQWGKRMEKSIHKLSDLVIDLADEGKENVYVQIYGLIILQTSLFLALVVTTTKALYPDFGPIYLHYQPRRLFNLQFLR